MSEGVCIDGLTGQRFVGVVDLSEAGFRPVRGYDQNASGKLVTVVRER